MYSFKCFSNVDILFRFDLRGSCSGSRGGSRGSSRGGFRGGPRVGSRGGSRSGSCRGSRSGSLSVSPSNRSCWSGLICLSGAGGTRVSGFRRCSSSGYLFIFSRLNRDISLHFVFPSIILFTVTIVPLIFVITYTYCPYGVSPFFFFSRLAITASPVFNLYSFDRCRLSWFLFAFSLYCWSLRLTASSLGDVSVG